MGVAVDAKLKNIEERLRGAAMEDSEGFQEADTASGVKGEGEPKAPLSSRLREEEKKEDYRVTGKAPDGAWSQSFPRVASIEPNPFEEPLRMGDLAGKQHEEVIAESQKVQAHIAEEKPWEKRLENSEALQGRTRVAAVTEAASLYLQNKQRS